MLTLWWFWWRITRIRAGNFEADAEEIDSGLLADKRKEKIYLSRLGASAACYAVLDAFNYGASLMIYLGHGGVHIWVDETPPQHLGCRLPISPIPAGVTSDDELPERLLSLPVLQLAQ